jgi:hypothetical protein
MAATLGWPPFLSSLDAHAWMVASTGETNRDMAWAQLAQKLGVYNIIWFKTL